MQPDYPAVHSRDTCFFAIDREGHLMFLASLDPVRERCFRWHTRWVTCRTVAPVGLTAPAGSADRAIVV